MSNNDLRQAAESLASRKYITLVRYGPDADGSPDYVALHPELPGLVAQGITDREARAALDEATKDWIKCLLEDGQPVPDPRPLGGIFVEESRNEWGSGHPSAKAMVESLCLHPV